MKDPTASCYGKQAFERIELARTAAQRINNRGNHVQAYRCERCRKWHVGTTQSHSARRRTR